MTRRTTATVITTVTLTSQRVENTPGPAWIGGAFVCGQNEDAGGGTQADHSAATRRMVGPTRALTREFQICDSNRG